MSIVDDIHLIKVRDGIKKWKEICKKLNIEPTEKKINSMKAQYSKALSTGRFDAFVIPEKPKTKKKSPPKKKERSHTISHDDLKEMLNTKTKNMVHIDLLLKLISSDNFLNFIKDKEKYSKLYDRCYVMPKQPDGSTARKIIEAIKEMIPELIKISK